MHSSSVRSADVYAGKRILLVGSSYSAKDIMLQAIKFGAQSVTIAHRKSLEAAMFNIPEGVRTKQGDVKFNRGMVLFQDGTEEKVRAKSI